MAVATAYQSLPRLNHSRPGRSQRPGLFLFGTLSRNHQGDCPPTHRITGESRGRVTSAPWRVRDDRAKSRRRLGDRQRLLAGERPAWGGFLGRGGFGEGDFFGGRGGFGRFGLRLAGLGGGLLATE